MNQTKPTFKAGDKVYFPKKSTKIYTLSKHEKNYIVELVHGGNVKSFTEHGKEYTSDNYPSIFHATKENCEKLSELYGVHFEKPRLFLDNHLEKGSKVLCLIVKNFPTELPKYIWDINFGQCTIDVIAFKQEDTYFNQHKVSVYEDIYPIAINSNGKITYLDEE